MITYELLISNTTIVLIITIIFLIFLLLISHKLEKFRSTKAKLAIELAILGLLLNFIKNNTNITSEINITIEILVKLITIFCVTISFSVLIQILIFHRYKKGVQPIILNLIDLIIYIFASIVVIRTIFKIEISSILTTSAILTGALVFALQNSLTNIFTGFSLQLNEHFKKGNWIYIKEKDIIGEIIATSFYFTVLKTLDNSIIIIPNHYFFNNIIEKISNINDLPTSAIKIRFSATYETPPHKIKSIVHNLLLNEPQIIQNPLPTVRLVNFGENGIDYEVKFYINDYCKKDVIKDEITTRIWYAMYRNNLSFPYPHREIIEKKHQKPYYNEKLDLLEIFSSIDILKPLDEKDKIEIGKEANITVFAPGETIIKQGEEGNSLYIILEGEVRILVDNHYLTSLKAGDFFGEMSLLSGENRNATVIADKETILIEIKKESFEKVLKKHSELVDTLSTILANREFENIEHRKKIFKNNIDFKERKQDFFNKIKNFFKL